TRHPPDEERHRTRPSRPPSCTTRAPPAAWLASSSTPLRRHIRTRDEQPENPPSAPTGDPRPAQRNVPFTVIRPAPVSWPNLPPDCAIVCSRRPAALCMIGPRARRTPARSGRRESRMGVGIRALHPYVGRMSVDIRSLYEARGHDMSRFGNLMMRRKSVNMPFEDAVTNAVNAALPLVRGLTPAERDRI